MQTNDTTLTAPFSALFRADENARTQDKTKNIEALAASIEAQGLLQNLVAYPDGDRFAVVAGGRRFAAIALLVEQGRKTADFPVGLKLVDKLDATAASLTENVQRENMHPADELDGFRKLFEGEGWSIDRIADAYGVTPLVVERRLRLRGAAPELIEAFRANEITTEQLVGLCASDDHARQVEVWNRYKHQSWNNDPKTLRNAVIGDCEIDITSDPRIAFIGGLDVYRKAGGEVRGDLFSGDGKSGGFITDVSLLDKLVADKLDAEAEAFRAEGWAWVEVWPHFDWQAFDRLGRVAMTVSELPEAAAAKVAELHAEFEALEAEQQGQHAKAEDEGRDDLTDAEWARDAVIDDRLEEIREAVDAIEAAHVSYAPEVKAAAGVVLIVERGALRIERGMVKTADRKAVAEATGSTSAVKGGRETESAGRKTDAVSDALRRSLLGHRNLAAQTEVAKSVDVAKVLLACWTVQHIRTSDAMSYTRTEVPSDLGISGNAGYGTGTRVGYPITDDAGKAQTKAFRKLAVEAVQGLPKAEGPLWDQLSMLPGEELDKIIAWGVALSVSVSEKHSGLTAKLLEALNFDMAEHFTATADNYLGRVPKSLMIEALTEAKKIDGSADRAGLDALKKGALAAEAEKRLAGSGWVPKGIRTPKPNPSKAAPAKKAAAKKTPAKKTPATKAAPSKAKAQAPRKASSPAEAQATA